jgi:hypothetical protein
MIKRKGREAPIRLLKNDFILGALQTRRGQLKGTNGLQKERSD